MDSFRSDDLMSVTRSLLRERPARQSTKPAVVGEMRGLWVREGLGVLFHVLLRALVWMGRGKRRVHTGIGAYENAHLVELAGLRALYDEAKLRKTTLQPHHQCPPPPPPSTLWSEQ